MLPTSQKAISFSGLQSQAGSVFIKELTPDALTTPQYRPYSQGYLGNINWTLQGKREKKKFQIWVGRHRKVDLLVMSECTMYTMHEIFKKINQKILKLQRIVPDICWLLTMDLLNLGLLNMTLLFQFLTIKKTKDE